MFKLLRTTSDRPLIYWVVGSILIWLPLPVSTLDMMIDPNWHAPHWQCDSLGIPIGQAYLFALPWAAIAMLISVLLTFIFTWKRNGGEDIFQFKRGSTLKNCVVSLPILLICGLLMIAVFFHIWDAAVPQTIVADCGGTAELITIIRRGPLLQITPFVYVGLIVWLLHLRMLALSSKHD